MQRERVLEELGFDLDLTGRHFVREAADIGTLTMRRRLPGETWPEFRYEPTRRTFLLLQKIRDNAIRLIAQQRPADAARLTAIASSGGDILAEIDAELARVLKGEPFPYELWTQVEPVLAGVESVAWNLDRLKAVFSPPLPVPQVELAVLRATIEAHPQQLEETIHQLIAAEGAQVTDATLGFLRFSPELAPLIGLILPLWVLVKLLCLLWLTWICSLLFFQLAAEGQPGAELAEHQSNLRERMRSLAEVFAWIDQLISVTDTGGPHLFTSTSTGLSSSSSASSSSASSSSSGSDDHCSITVTVTPPRLCVNAEGQATAVTSKPGKLTWVLGPGLRLLSPPGSKTIKFKAVRPGCTSITVKLKAGKARCSDTERVSVVEPMLVLGTQAPVQTVGIAGYAPTIELTSPLTSGAQDEPIRLTRNTGDSPSTFVSEPVQFDGVVRDPLGTEGCSLFIQAGPGIELDTDTIDLPEDGSFSFKATIKGFGDKLLWLWASGRTGEAGMMVVAGRLDYPIDSHADIHKQHAERSLQKHQDWSNRSQSYIKDHDEFEESKLNDLNDELNQQLVNIFDEQANALKGLLDDLKLVMSAGEAKPLPAAVPDNARYRLAAKDCRAPRRESGSVEAQAFTLERQSSDFLLSADPEAFVALLASGSGVLAHRDKVPGHPKDVLLPISRDIQRYPTLRAQVGHCEFDARLFKVIITGDPYAFLYVDKDPDTDTFRSVNSTKHTLEASIIGGATNQLRSFKWQIVYGPKVNGATITPINGNGSKADFSAGVAGTYLVEARAVTDHENELAVGVFRVDAMEIEFELHSDVLGLQDGDESAPQERMLVSLDHRQLEVEALINFYGEGRRPLPPEQTGIHTQVRWAGHHAGGAFKKDDSHSASYELGTTTSEIITVRAEAYELTYPQAARPIDLSDLVIQKSLPDVFLEAGRPQSAEAKIYIPGGNPSPPWVRLTAAGPFDEVRHDDPRILQTATPWSRFPLQTRIQPDDPAQNRDLFMALTIRILDEFGNPCRAKTPVHAELFGDGELGFGSTAGSEAEKDLDENGTLRLQYRAGEGTDSPSTRLKSLVRVDAGDVSFFIGDVLAGAQFEVTGVPGQTTVTGDTITFNNASNRAAISVAVFIDVQGVRRYLPASTRVAARISDGSVESYDGKKSPDGIALLSSGGQARFHLSPVCYSADGSRHLLKFDAWGVASLHLSVGAGARTYKVDFDSARSIRLRPRMRFRSMPFISQADYVWVPRPADVGGQPGVTATPQETFALHGEGGKSALLELRERLRARALVRFSLSSAISGDFNPTFSNLIPDPALPASTLETQLIVGTGVLSHVKTSNTVRPPLGTDPASVRIARDVIGTSALAALGVRYGSPLPGSAGFEVSIFVNPMINFAGEVLRVEGSRTGGAIFAEKGALSLKLADTGTAMQFRVEFEADGCPGLARIRATPITGQLPTGSWTKITIRVEPSMKDRRTDLTVTLGIGPGAAALPTQQISGFNFLPGTTYHATIGIPDAGACYLYQLEYSCLSGDVLNLLRSDGLATPWLAIPFQQTGSMPLLVRQRTPDDTPIFAGPVSPFAKFTFGYCDSADWETADIAALDPTAIKAFNYVSDFANAFLFGESRSVAGFAGDFGAGMVGWGDLRDIVKNLAYAVPGGQEPDWKVFWLAVLGLALDLGQVFTAGAAAAPNAVVAVLKEMLIYLRRVANPESSRIARHVGYYARKLLLEWHALKIGRAVQVGSLINDLSGLRKLLGEDFIDFFLLGIDAKLQEIVDHFRHVPFPGPPNFNTTQVVIAAATAAPAITDTIETLTTRIEIISHFFNPKVSSAARITELCGWFLAVRKNLEVEDKRLLKLLRTAADPATGANWRVYLKGPDQAERAGEAIAHAFARLHPFMKQLGAENISPNALRGFVAYVASSGPHRAIKVLDNFCPNGKITKEFLEHMQDCDRARKLLQDLRPLDYAGNPSFYLANERFEILNSLWTGLAARTKDGKPAWRSVSGAIAELRAIREFGDQIKVLSPLGIGQAGRLERLQDLLFEVNHALEVKSLMSGKDLILKINRMKRQLRRWVEINKGRRATSSANPGMAPQPIIDTLTYAIMLPQNHQGRRWKKAITELNAYSSQLAKRHGEDVVPLLQFRQMLK